MSSSINSQSACAALAIFGALCMAIASTNAAPTQIQPTTSVGSKSDSSSEHMIAAESRGYPSSDLFDEAGYNPSSQFDADGDEINPGRLAHAASNGLGAGNNYELGNGATIEEADARDSDDDDSADDEGSSEDESKQVFRNWPVNFGSAANLRGQDSNIDNARVEVSSNDMQTAAGHHHHKKHHVHGKLDMGAHTGKKGSFGWHSKHPVGKGK